jgi:hypothetical protein
MAVQSLPLEQAVARTFDSGGKRRTMVDIVPEAVSE